MSPVKRLPGTKSFPQMKKTYKTPTSLLTKTSVERNILSGYGQGSLPGVTGWDNDDDD